MANSTGVEIFNDFKSFLADVLSGIGNRLKKESTYSEALLSFKMSVFEINQTMESLDSEQKLMTAVKRTGVFFEPRQFIVNEETIQVEGDFEEKYEYGTVMPIKDHIIKFLEQPNVFQRILGNQEKLSNSNVSKSLVNGSVWRKILEKYTGKDVIPISLYCDEFNSDSNKDSKINAFYYAFPTLPNFVSTSIENIFLALL